MACWTTEGPNLISSWYFGEALPTWALFAELVVAGTVVILAGARFTRLADTFATRLNIGGGWIGLILLATVTSLPEVVTGGTATAIGNSGMAMAAVFGSCSFNITLIVLLNALMRSGSVLRGVSASHSLTSTFGLLLMGIAMLGVLLGAKFTNRPYVAEICEGAWASVILVTYLGCMRLVFRYERREQEKDGPKTRGRFGAWGYAQIAAMAIIIVGASWWLALIGDVLSVHPIELIGRPLGATFVGAGFLALATSLPEITTSVAAVRLGNLDMALGNIFGSNMFNIFVIPMLKAVSLFNGERLLMAHAGFDATQTLITGLLAIVLTAIAVAGLTYQTKKKMLNRFGFDSILIAAAYVAGMVLIVMEAR